MKYWLTPFLLGLLTFISPIALQAQCAHDPRITGDTLLCPNENGLLSTQQADTYQWYSRPYGSSTTSPVSGATTQTLSIGPNDVLYYFSVDATLAGCTERSPEVLIDGYVFLLPYVISTGDFTIGGNGESIICVGDTMYFTMGLPYDTLITWYLNGNPIPGYDSTTLIVTQPGTYTCQGAPRVCPNYLMPLGLDLVVEDTACAVAITPPHALDFQIYPNPITQNTSLQLQLVESSATMEIFNTLGALVYRQEIDAPLTQHDLSNLAPATYNLRITSPTQEIATHRILILPK